MTIRAKLDSLRRKQIAHICEHQQAFEAHAGKGRQVEAYFDDYWEAEEPDALYLNLCSDLDIKPLPEAMDI